MKIKQLLAGVEVLKTNISADTEITEVVYDSRKVTPGSLFVAITGFATDGNRYIPMALEKGAAAVVSAQPQPDTVPYIQVRSDRLALAQIGGNYYGHPGSSMKLIGITGTNGKTSSTLLLKHILQQVMGAKVGLVGTMGNMIGELSVPGDRTTPESFELQGLLAQMRDAGCSHVVMEVSSHAIALDRVAGLQYDVAAFTNLTEDHLDFHETMENYCDTKAELFRRCKTGIFNGDDRWYSRMSENATCEKMIVSVKGQGDLQAEDLELLSDGVSFAAVCGNERVKVQLPMPGKFTVYNALTAIGCAVALGITLSDAASALASAAGVKGRVEVVPTPGKDYTVLIDYAHTPDGLENVLTAVKGYCKGRVIAVFGCGGDRDPVKRPIMGRIGVELADYAIITSDNPRTEEPEKIIQDILKGVDSAKNNYEVIENRPKAIQHAMDIGKKNDIIVLAGKDHETYQEICGVKHHLDEREVVVAYLNEMRNR